MFIEHLNGLTLWCELDSIRQEVAEDGLYHVVVAMNSQLLLSRNILQVNLLHLGNHLEDVYRTRNNVIKIYILIDHIQAASLTLRPLQQVVQQVMRLF